MMENNKYKNPPLEEVVCEFRFDLENPNDTILPGLLYNKISKEFPIRRQRNIGSISSPKGGSIEQEFLVHPLAQFYSKDETRLVQVGMDMLSINSIKNYPTWEKYKPLILEIYSIYRKIANPKSIKRIGLRTINKITIDRTNIELKDYFKFHPSSPVPDKEPIAGFLLQIEKIFYDGRDRIIMKNGTIVADKPNMAAFLLDFDYVMSKPNNIALNQVDKWLEAAHIKLKTAFESCITDNLRNQFNK
jgi:uncharacterized protein (TIGR04255 family)